jgi:hypothetical protein
MLRSLRNRRRNRPGERSNRSWRKAWLRLETLEARSLPASLFWPGLSNPVAEHESNDVLTQANDLGSLSLLAPADVVGQIGGTAGDADVDWYQFTLDGPAYVHAATLARSGGSPLSSVLGLYNYTPFEFGDPYSPFHYRLMVQQDGAGGDASVDRLLGAGTYYLAVSGTGNRYFNPFLAGSGYPGSQGAYGLQITATPYAVGPDDGPAVLNADPAPGSALDSSPFALRVGLSAPLDLSTVNAGWTVSLTSNPTGTFGDGNDQDVPLTFTNYDFTLNELQLFPGVALAPGTYQLLLAGDRNRGDGAYIAGLDGNPLGKDANHPDGHDFTLTFDVTGIEGRVGAATADDTLATAHELGDITQAGLVQRAGAVGDDPTDPFPLNPGDVDIYHFQISGTGRFAFTAEAFAGRIGSPLNSAVTLFQVVDGQLRLVQANDDSRDGVLTDNFQVPLFTDATLFAGLGAGDYYVAVSSSPNLPDATIPWQPGPNPDGIFDPTSSHSATTGWGPAGPYVLNLYVTPDNLPPVVMATSPAPGDLLSQPPTQLTVRFNEPVNLSLLAFEAYQHNPGSDPTAVFIQGSGGTRYYPRLTGFDPVTNEAMFLMLDGLPNGAYELHLSGKAGLADFAGNALVGNDPADPSGDYVVRFTVGGAPRGVNGNPHTWADRESNNTPPNAQSLGVLFPHELEGEGVVITRDFTGDPVGAPADTADYFEFTVLQAQNYLFTLAGLNLPPGVTLDLRDAGFNPVDFSQADSGLGIQAYLQPGTYVLGVSGWSPSEAPDVTYQLTLALGGASDNPPALTAGPAPAIRITLAKDNGAAGPGVTVPSAPAGGSATPPGPGVSSPGSFGTGTPPGPVGLPVTPATGSLQLVVTLPPVSLSEPGLTGPVTAAPSPVTVPANLLIALGTGPAGGVRATENGMWAAGTLTVSPDRVVVRPASPTLTDGLVRMTILTSPNGANGLAGIESYGGMGELSEHGPGAPAPGLIQSLLRSWRNTVDALFGMTDWMRSLTPWRTDLPASSEGGQPAEEISIEAPAELDAAWADGAFSPGLTDTMVAALASVSAAGFLRPLEKRERRRATWLPARRRGRGHRADTNR